MSLDCVLLKEPKLPKKLSNLILAALEDAEAVIGHPKFGLNMGRWSRLGGPRNSICYVCLAGAVMANRFHVSPVMEDFLPGLNIDNAPSDFGDDVENKFLALDAVRMGDIDDAIYHVHGYVDDRIDIANTIGLAFQKKFGRELRWGGKVTDKDWPAFKAQLSFVARQLKKHGL